MWINVTAIMCSTQPDVDHLVLTEAGGGGVNGIGDVEINEWSELLTNEQEIAVTQRIPVSLATITDINRRINGKFKRIDSINATWQNRNPSKIVDTKLSNPQRSSDYYMSNTANSFINNSSDGVSLDSISPPPQLPPKSSALINNVHLNGHANILNNVSGKTSSNNVTSPTSADWIELKTTNRINVMSPTLKISASSRGAIKRNGFNIPSTTVSNGNLTMRPPPPPPSTAPSQQNLNAGISTTTSRKMSSTSSSSLSSSSMSSSMTLAVSSSPSSREKCIPIRNQHQDLPNIHIQPHSNPQRAISSSSSTGVSPTSSSSSSSATVGSSPSGILQPTSHSLNSSAFLQSRDCNGMVSEVDRLGSSSNNFTNNVINNENYKPTTASTTLSQLVSASSSQRIMVHQQHPSAITTTVLSAYSAGNSSHVGNNNSNAMQLVLSNTSSSSSSSSSTCCNETSTINSNCSKEKIIRGKTNFVRHHNHHPLKPPSKNSSHTFMSENKGPAPQPPIFQQPRPKMILIHQRSLDFNGADLKNEDNNLEFSSNAIIKQPTRSTSVSRGLQVEEQDLIQFSSQQSRAQQENHPPGSPSNNSTAKLIPPNNNNNINNNIGKSPLNKRSEENDEGRINDNEEKSDKKGDKCDDIKGDDNKIEGLDNNANDCGEDDDEETSSARTADEQMDYLESLEPCPCYAKCCLDSIITLFCVTLLG